MQALHQPEILSFIGHFLSEQDQVRCALVCSSWNTAFSALFCHTLDLSHVLAYASYKPFLARNAHWIFDLQMEIMGLSSHVPYLASTTDLVCLRLVQVQDLYAHEAFQLKRWNELAGFIQQNPDLQHLSIWVPSKWASLTPSVQFWRALGGATNLRSLSLSGIVVEGGEQESSPEWMDAFLDACTSLESLVLDRVSLGPPTEKWLQQLYTPFRKLQHTTLYGQGDALQLLIKWSLESPKFRLFSWDYAGFCTRQDDQRMHSLLTECFAAQSRGLSELESISLQGQAPFEDEQLGRILEACSMNPLKDLILRDSNFGKLAFKALCQPLQGEAYFLHRTRPLIDYSSPLSSTSKLQRSHLASLRCLDLLGCFDITDSMVQHLLASCPLLEVFMGTSLHIKEIISGQGVGGEPGWVCHRLKKLELFLHGFADHADEEMEYVGGDELEKRNQLAVFRELSQLSRLQDLNVGQERLLRGIYDDGGYDKGLDFQEGFGRELLVGQWNDLQTLDLRSTETRLDVVDVEWLAVQFPRLTEFECTNYGFWRRENVLRDAFQAAVLARLTRDG